ncbi:hypothetical protein JTB14_005315 [Gonioctena quinquepunctata]|nr:hypothetical protein JTB14_005315 [Gonioctena quinquepunctata]
MRRSCRIVTEEQEKINQEKKRKKKRTEIKKKKRKKKKGRRKRLGGTTKKQFKSKENHSESNVRGNKERTEKGCGYETITEKELEVLESRKLEQYRSGYQESEDDNKEADSNMETNQMEKKTGTEKKREQEKLEKDKREQLRKIREKQKEKEIVEKSEKTPTKGKTYIKSKTELPRLATSENNKINSSSESQRTQEESSEAEAGRKGIDIIRTEDRRKYKGKTPSQEAYLRTHQKLADLKNDIKKAARLWTEKAKENIHRNLSRNKVEFIPYSVLYESQHETLYKYWMETLTKKYENEIHLLTVKLHALAGIEEKDIVPESQEEEKENKQKQRKEKPTTKPVQDKQKGGRLLSKRPSLNDIELSNQYQLLANQGGCTVETDTEADDQNRGMDTDEAAKKEARKEKRERQKAATRKNFAIPTIGSSNQVEDVSNSVMPEDSTKFVAETLPSSSELTLLGSDVSIDNPFRLLLSGNEADGETLLDSSHLADSKNHKDDSNIQEVAETCFAARNQILKIAGHCMAARI